MDWAMSLLLNHPEAMEKVKSEIDTKVGQERMLEEQDLPKLNYSQNVINEARRLYPPGAILPPHEASQDFVVGGFDVPQGTTVFIKAWNIHRDPETREEPAKFRPERFEGGMVKDISISHLVLGNLIQSFEWGRVGEKKVDMSEGLGFAFARVEPLEAMRKPRPIMLSSI